MRVLDPGHIYTLHALDGGDNELLRFVKRCNPPELYPGNKSAHPGTTSQEVMRALIDRNEYVQNQLGHWANPVVGACLKLAIWALEMRAARRHGRFLWIPPWRVHKAPICPVCGHVGHKC